MPGTQVPTLRFGVPAPPWSTNQDRNLNPYKRAERVKLWKQVAYLHAKALYREHGNQPFDPSIVQIHIPFSQERRRDPHNYCGTVLKAVIDGLVLAGLWPDDTPEWVGHREPVLYKGKQVIVQITPMTETTEEE